MLLSMNICVNQNNNKKYCNTKNKLMFKERMIDAYKETVIRK